MRYVYGLDLSMSCTGYCVMDLEGNIVKSGIIKPKTSYSHGMKLREYSNKFFDLACEFEPLVVGIEEGFTRFNKATQIVFRVHGIANYSFCDYEQIYYQNKTVKKFFTGNGNAGKPEMMSEVKRRYGLEVTNDEADAIAVAEMTRKEYLKRLK